jgi:hypothetical protein
MYHVVLTQKILPEDSLAVTRERFKAKWTTFYGSLRKLGMESALATYHVKWSANGGWHYHCHLLIEIAQEDEDEAARSLDYLWQVSLGGTEAFKKPVFVRKVCSGGGPMVGMLENQQLEIWKQSTDAVECVLQYMLRDVLQGIEGWVESVMNGFVVKQFVEELQHCKLHRLYGRWRKVIEKDDDDEANAVNTAASVEERNAAKAKGVKVWITMGTVDYVLWGARNKVQAMRDLVTMLVTQANNKGPVASRLFLLAREIAL